MFIIIKIGIKSIKITRNQYNEMPVRVEYTLTDKGENTWEEKMSY
ncbi:MULTISPECIES: winged helix-turn-helix transcriptional regulator [Clostridium]|nr:MULTISPECIES: winged helix-turn-helix transcriptional regulator [Clostridium]